MRRTRREEFTNWSGSVSFTQQRTAWRWRTAGTCWDALTDAVRERFGPVSVTGSAGQPDQ